MEVCVVATVSRKHLLDNMKPLRHLFALTGLDVTLYSDAAIADAVHAICPEFGDGWPSDDDLRATHARLVARA